MQILVCVCVCVYVLIIRVYTCSAHSPCGNREEVLPRKVTFRGTDVFKPYSVVIARTHTHSFTPCRDVRADTMLFQRRLRTIIRSLKTFALRFRQSVLVLIQVFFLFWQLQYQNNPMIFPFYYFTLFFVDYFFICGLC